MKIDRVPRGHMQTMADSSEPPILDKIRGMWEFAAVTQFFYLFYDMFGLEDFDVEVRFPAFVRQMELILYL